MENVIGERIRTLRKENNFSQTKLALMLNTTQDTVSLWELGKSYPSVKDVIRLASIFSVSSDYLLGIVDY